MRPLVSFVIVILLAGCGDTTGSGLVTFTARAGGPADVRPGGPLDFDTGSGYHVSLKRARLHLGAVYLNLTVPSSGGHEQPCILPGIYVGQAFGSCSSQGGRCGIDRDLLTPDLMPFPLSGQGTVNHASEAEVWLTGGDINAPDDPTPILDVAGTASRGGKEWPFTATVTIGRNRAVPVQNPALPGANPICHQRIVSLIPVDFTLSDGGTLDLRVDPRGMFHGVNFAALAPGAGMPTSFPIPDEPGGPGGALYQGVHANSGVYLFTWIDKAQ